MDYLTLSDLSLNNKRVMIREDFNVPIDSNGHITSDARIRAALPTIQAALSQNAAVILLSHLGQPKEEKEDAAFSLKPVADRLSELLKQPVPLISNWLSEPIPVLPGQVVLCENVRFNPGEKKNDEQLSKAIASLCDIYVMDAFATAHRKQASTYGAIQFAKVACAGPLLASEIKALEQITQHPKRPLIAIVGGSKISTKLTLLKSLIRQVDALILGGGIANNFIAAKGLPIGTSLYEPDLIPETQEILKEAGEKVIFPQDVITAKTFDSTALGTEKCLIDVEKDDKILDIGTHTIQEITQRLKQAGTILWNGPLGVFEWKAFSGGTEGLAKAIAESPAYSVAGGGDTLAAIEKYGVESEISYISTGGGAFLAYLEEGTLPAIEALKRQANSL